MSDCLLEPVDLLPPTLTATALAEELAEYEAALAAVHFDGQFDEVASFEPFDSLPKLEAGPVSSRSTMPFPPANTAAASGAFDIGLVSHVDVVRSTGLLLDDEEEEEVPPTMRSPSSAQLVVNERPVRVTMEELPSSRQSGAMLTAVKVA